MNQSSGVSNKEPGMPWLLPLVTFSISFIIMLIISGNILVITVMTTDKSLKRSLQNRLIISLALADLLLGLFVMPLSLYNEIQGEWKLGSLLCNIWLSTDVLLCTASTLSLVAVTMDRLMSVIKPLEYPQSRTAKRMNIMIAGVWTTAAVVSLPPIFGWKSKTKNSDNTVLTCDLSDELGYILYSLTISFYVPLIMIFTAYSRIFVIARRASHHVTLGKISSKYSIGNSCNEVGQTRCLNNQPAPTERLQKLSKSLNLDPSIVMSKSCSTSVNIHLDANQSTVTGNMNQSAVTGNMPTTSSVCSNAYEADQAATTSRSSKVDRKANKDNRGHEKRATFTIAILIAAFVVCWLPFSTLYLIDALCRCGIRESSAFKVIFWLGYCNSAANPVLYSVFNHEFRRSLSRLLSKRSKKYAL